MKKISLIIASVAGLVSPAIAQNIKTGNVPVAVKQAFAKKYPGIASVNWEKEKGNYEANWGGRSGEDTSVLFTPNGAFAEEANAIPVSQLPPGIVQYAKTKYGASIKEAAKVTDATGKKMFEAEIKGKDMLFDENGKFIKID